MQNQIIFRVSVASLVALLCVAHLSFAILNGNDNATTTASTPTTSRAQQDSNSDANTTFYYEANAFLLNKNVQDLPVRNETSSHESASKQQVSSAKSSAFPPASVAMTSGRNGRMMDLDALVGDIQASRANRERNHQVAGNRQSRFLSGQSLDVGPGKKLHIQGFIPIMGLKDTSDDNMSDDSSDLDHQVAAANQLLQQHQQKARAHSPKSNHNDLPYAQSSIGHATYGVHRYLNSEPNYQQQYQPEAPKSGGSSMVDTLTKPIKKLAGFVGSGGEQSQKLSSFTDSPQNCLCVPFYMCKNGFISESSLGKAQVQQMIAQQQYQNIQPFKQVDSMPVEMKSSQIIVGTHQPMNEPQNLQLQQQVHNDFAFAPVDERSFDRELVTMSSLNSFSDVSHPQVAGAIATNQSTFVETVAQTGESSAQQQSSGVNVETNLDSGSLSASTNSTDNVMGNSADYSQDILGRMLGLKSASGSRLSQSGEKAGVCGILRTCCNIPMNMLPSQQDMANEKLMAQHATGHFTNPKQFSYPQKTNTFYPSSQQQNDLAHQIQMQQQQQQAAVALQKYQAPVPMPSVQRPQVVPYGFPARTQQQGVVLRPQQTPNSFNTFTENSLAHRSNQLLQQQQPQVSTRYLSQQQPAPIQLAQYTRSNQQALQMQAFQQQPKSLPIQVASSPMQTVNSPLALKSISSPLTVASPSLGTRKILDGRCGLRQAAGITGRVQNLQYHESSADFGEYPAQAAILKRLPGSDSLFVCGGTLISQYWVATAAHCIKKHAQNDLKIRLGEWDVHRDDEFYPYVEKEVRDLVVHPEFVAGNLVNDIALLRLDSPVDPSLPHVNPACLPMIDESFNKQRCWVTGWGKDSFGQKGSFQAVMREVELPVVGHDECESALRQTRLGPHYRLHSGFICAGGEGGKDACEGDGGSGLYCAQDGVIKVAGLVSWGIGCGQAGVPGVYVNLAHYRPWIENIISIDEDIYSPYANMLTGSSLISERSNLNSSSSAPSVEDGATSSTTIATTTT